MTWYQSNFDKSQSQKNPAQPKICETWTHLWMNLFTNSVFSMQDPSPRFASEGFRGECQVFLLTDLRESRLIFRFEQEETKF